MNALYDLIYAQLFAKVAGLRYVNWWNNQVENMISDEAKFYEFDMPAAFIEFDTSNVEQLGAGYQLYDPLLVRVHIVHRIEAGINMDSPEVAQDYKQLVYKALQRFEPQGAVAFVRVSEEPDYSHNNIYHFVQVYQTNYIDQDAIPETISKQPPTDLELTADYSQPPYQK